MKLTLKIVVAAIIMSLLCFAVQAQPVVQGEETPSTFRPKWVSGLGFWVVQSNVNDPKESIIYFYNNNNVQVYKETVNGEVLKLKKRRTLMMLKKTLETAVIAWQQNKPIGENEKLFIAALGK